MNEDAGIVPRRLQKRGIGMESTFVAGKMMCVATIWLAAMTMSGTTAIAAEGNEPVLPGLSAVLGELRQGGLIIYLRHGATDQSGSKDEDADLTRCETQRNLSSEGREQATRIGKAIRTLGIPVGTVTTSPFCRAKDTAELALGRSTANNDLYFAINANAAESKRLSASLRQMLSTPPAQRTNAVIVSHTANLREAAGIWPKPEGVAYVFRPLPGGRFEPVARILPDEWLATVKKH